MLYSSEQEKYWAEEYAQDYINDNNTFDHSLGSKAWSIMLGDTKDNISGYLECGCNIGRNIEQISKVIPDAERSIIEISPPAYNYVTNKYKFANAFQGAILDSNFKLRSFDLVFTMGVLIHINPNQLLSHMEKMYKYSGRYILIGEYFNHSPISVDYHGEKEKLFKRDFGKLFIENFDCELVNYGFFWGHIYDIAGFDDITWWMFEKNI